MYNDVYMMYITYTYIYMYIYILCILRCRLHGRLTQELRLPETPEIEEHQANPAMENPPFFDGVNRGSEWAIYIYTIAV